MMAMPGAREAPPPVVALASRYARRLLASLGVEPIREPEAPEEHPAIGWAHSGLMALTGPAAGAPQVCPVPITSCADGALAALASLAPPGALADLSGSRLLGERAALSGFTRKGSVSPGGGCYLLETADGAIGVSLARDDDWSVVRAWLETDAEPTWESVRRDVARRTMHDLVERGRLLGLAVAPDVPVPSKAVNWFANPVSSALPREGGGSQPVVVDLSSLWAGPLCARLLQKCGARVIKVESTQRPDGARRGPPAFFAALNDGKESVSLDLSGPAGRKQLRALIEAADIVIEASRPRALRQLGIRAEELLERKPRLTWLSITGYGRGEPQENWIAYGDDAGVAAGLSHVMRQATGQRLICGDAIADPLTGVHAALAAWWSHRAGGGRLIALSLVDVVRHCLQLDLPPSIEALRARQREWSALV